MICNTIMEEKHCSKSYRCAQQRRALAGAPLLRSQQRYHEVRSLRLRQTDHACGCTLLYARFAQTAARSSNNQLHRTCFLLVFACPGSSKRML
jgi:hypothetical protein